jgi:heme oxygenase
LREGTRAAHRRVEAMAPMACLLAHDLSAGSYIAALRAMQSFHVMMHMHVSPMARGASLPGSDPAALAALTADLAWFGVTAPPVLRRRRPAASLPAALGALYVAEGSALGGRVIGRAVAASLSVSPGRGGSFYGGATADGARERWRDFCAVLAREGSLLDAAGFARAVAGAEATFQYLERLLQNGPSGHAQPHATRQRLRAVNTAVPDRARAAARTMI